ncbi:hypothetical protein QBC43DRAFT_331476 [Cladorrhinum sp. PSN259]|nr:hypothetical protein QBC43DRAFT_331476 [Cladorrhinum sp. PSN259]
MTTGREEINLAFLKSKVPSLRCISLGEARKLTCSRSLADIWATVSETELTSLAEEVALTIKQIRHLGNVRMCPRTHPREQPNLGHSLIFKGFDFCDFSHQESNSAIFRELSRAMDETEGLVVPGESAAWLYEIQGKLLKKMPNFAPFVFTHGDLCAKYIFVNTATRKLTAITGWSGAEYCPVFWEYSSLLWGDLPPSDEIELGGGVVFASRDRQWKRMLKGAMEKHEPYRDLFQAGNWVKALGIVRTRHHLLPERMDSVLEYLSSRDYCSKELEPECYGHPEL